MTDGPKTSLAIRLADNKQLDAVELSQRNSRSWRTAWTRLHAFAKGQFVKWKPGLKNRKFPDIVTAVLPSPIFDPSESAAASPYFQEPLSIIIGTCREDDFLEFRVDGRWIRTVRMLN